MSNIKIHKLLMFFLTTSSIKLWSSHAQLTKSNPPPVAMVFFSHLTHYGFHLSSLIYITNHGRHHFIALPLLSYCAFLLRCLSRFLASNYSFFIWHPFASFLFLFSFFFPSFFPFFSPHHFNHLGSSLSLLRLQLIIVNIVTIISHFRAIFWNLSSPFHHFLFSVPLFSHVWKGTIIHRYCRIVLF